MHSSHPGKSAREIVGRAEFYRAPSGISPDHPLLLYFVLYSTVLALAVQ